MNITIVADVLGRENNGTTITAKRLIQQLKLRGHNVRVVSPTHYSEEGYYTLPKKNFFVFNGYIKKNGVELAAVDKKVLAEAIEGADVVHLLVPFAAANAALEIAREKKIAVTSAFHCQAENITAHLKLKNWTFLNDFIYYFLYKKFYHKMRFVHCPTQFIANVLTEHNYKNLDLRVISNGVDPHYVKRESARKVEWQDKFVIIFVGRFSNEKRHDVLIEAVARSKHKEQIRLEFAGDGPIKAKVMKLAKKLNVDANAGFYSQNELVDLLNAADLYVHPSEIEIEAISCLEAITCGLVPVISDSKRSATNAFALTEHNLFACNNSQSLADKIDALIDNPALLGELREKYNAYADEFKLERCVDKMELMFKDAVEYYKQLDANVKDGGIKREKSEK